MDKKVKLMKLDAHFHLMKYNDRDQVRANDR